MNETGGLVLRLPPEAAEALAQRVAEIMLAALERDKTPLHPYMTTGEAAEYLRCSRQHIYDLRSSGRLSCLRDGSRALVSRAELDALVAVGEGLHEQAAVPYNFPNSQQKPRQRGNAPGRGTRR